MNYTKVIFIKDGFYNNKKYKKDEIINMSLHELEAYINCKVVKLYYGKKESVKQNKNYANMKYKELQNLCKKNNIRAVGTKQELIHSLENGNVFDLTNL